MTRRIALNLDLNENDLDALQAVLAKPKAVAVAVAPNDPWEHARIVDVLVEMAGSIADAMKPEVDGELSD